MDFDWSPIGKKDKTEIFSKIIPDDVLYDFDGPRIFTFRQGTLKQFLAYLCDEIPSRFRHIVARTNSRTIANLKNDALPVRDALAQPRVWVVDINGQGEVLSVWKVAALTLPHDVLPAHGAFLHPTALPITGTTRPAAILAASAAKMVIDDAR